MSRRKPKAEEALIEELKRELLDRQIAQFGGVLGLSRHWRQVSLESRVVEDRAGSAAASAIAATGSKNPKAWRTLLDDVAGKLIEAPAGKLHLTGDEMFFVYAILSEIAEGVDPRIGLRIDPQKIGHRPSKMDLRWAIALEVQERVDEGEAVGDAIRAVAKITGRTIDQVRIDHRLLKSKRDKS